MVKHKPLPAFFCTSVRIWTKHEEAEAIAEVHLWSIEASAKMRRRTIRILTGVPLISRGYGLGAFVRNS